MITAEMEKKIEKAMVEELTPIDIEKRYDEMIDECYPEVNVGVTFNPSRVLKEMDEIAYRCGLNDFIDSENWVELNGNYYDSDEVEEIRNRIEEEGV